MAVPQKLDPEKYCEVCQVRLARKRYGTRLEDRSVFLRRRFCSLSCANTRDDESLSRDGHHWRARQHRKLTCEDCGVTTHLHVHHKDRDRTNNAPDNLRTLCSSCHLKLHWRENRQKRLAARRGARTGQRSIAGS